MQQKWENERTMEQERTEELQTAREILITQVRAPSFKFSGGG